ncbi:chemotaxis protein CheW [bacterium]|nr:chemotaxis protein CheW [bacterium]
METRWRRDSASEAGEKYLTFRLADEEFGVDIQKVREIIGMIGITRIPRAPQHISGVINLRGSVIPVLDLRERLGMERREKTRTSCIMVANLRLRDRYLNVGVVVDSVSEVLDLRPDEIESAPSFAPDVESGMIEGIGKKGERVIMLLNLNAVATEEDLKFTLGQNSKGREK